MDARGGPARNERRAVDKKLDSVVGGQPDLDGFLERAIGRVDRYQPLAAEGKDVVAVEKGLLKHIPKEFMIDAHHWLILHGRYTCIARKPRCNSCMIEDLCDFKEKTE